MGCPVLEGYSWVHVPNISPQPGLGRFFGLVNPGLWKTIRTGRFDVIVNLTSYMYASFWITVGAAKAQAIPCCWPLMRLKLSLSMGRIGSYLSNAFSGHACTA